MLFAFLFVQFIITSVSTVLTVATFITNKLYLSSLANTGFSIVRLVRMMVFFGFLPPMVMYVGLGSLCGTFLTVLLNYRYTRLTPELILRKDAISWPLVREMLSSGMWNVVIKLQQVISFGLKLLVANLMINPYKMGMMSIAQTVPSMVFLGLMGTISGLFYPAQTPIFRTRTRYNYILLCFRFPKEDYGEERLTCEIDLNVYFLFYVR